MEYHELQKLKRGAKVRSTDEDMHRRFPQFYPAVGTIGTLISANYIGAWVDWEDDHFKCKGLHLAPAFMLSSVLESASPRHPKILITVDKADPRKVIAKDLDSGKTGVAKRNSTDEFDFYTGAKLAFSRLCGEDKPKNEPKPKRKFKVGDKVVGNKLANIKYSITKEGWKGVVTKLDDDERYIWVTESSGDDPFMVMSVCFDFFPEPKGWNGKVVCVRANNPSLTVGKVYTVKDGVMLGNNGKPVVLNVIPDFSVFSDPHWFSSKFVEYKGEN